MKDPVKFPVGAKPMTEEEAKLLKDLGVDLDPNKMLEN